MTSLVEPPAQMTATAASRHFSDVLDRAEAGLTTILIRNGQAVAQVAPVQPAAPNGGAIIDFLTGWQRSLDGFRPEYESWLDSLDEPNARDRERLSWVASSR